MQMKKMVLAGLLAATVSVAAGGCGVMDAVQEGIQEGLETLSSQTASLSQSEIQGKSVTFTTYDGSFSVMAPSGWEDLGQSANEDAELALGSADGSVGFLLFLESRTDFSEDVDYRAYLDLAVQTMELDNMELGAVTELTLDDRPAAVQTVTGESAPYRFQYWVYAVQYDDVFARYVFYCSASEAQKAQPTVETIVQSIGPVQTVSN